MRQLSDIISHQFSVTADGWLPPFFQFPWFGSWVDLGSQLPWPWSLEGKKAAGAEAGACAAVAVQMQRSGAPALALVKMVPKWYKIARMRRMARWTRGAPNLRKLSMLAPARADVSMP